MTTLADLAFAPGGGSLAVTAPSLQLSSRGRIRERWRQGVDGEGVNIRFEQVSESRIDQAMAGNGRHAAKRLRHDANAKVAQAIGRTGVPGVQVALVLNDKFQRRESEVELFAKALRAGR